MIMLKNLFKKPEHKVDFENLPQHIGIIMDGNGRWAKKRGLPRSSGHAAGAKTFERIVEDAGNIGIKIVTVYAFSTENWSRPKEEVNALMALLEDYLDHGLERLSNRDVKIHFIGDMSAFSDEFQKKLCHMEKTTYNNSGLLLNVALNYGGRNEITNAVRIIAEKVKDGELSCSDITEETISEHLYTSGQADPDLIIRPSGEYRLSNFLLWQSAYSEFWYSNCLWPDFTKEDLLKSISDFQKRNRRFGGV
ncbi:MAG: isoprenyl transferase [Ruminococcaceae bacterium]|nr:isoprenyl transferase [Oscillospiraceae bacterium]